MKPLSKFKERGVASVEGGATDSPSNGTLARIGLPDGARQGDSIVTGHPNDSDSKLLENCESMI